MQVKSLKRDTTFISPPFSLVNTVDFLPKRSWLIYPMRQNKNHTYLTKYWECRGLIYTIHVPSSYILARCLNSSLLECSPPRFNSRPRLVRLRTSSLGWRWPWSSLFIVVTPTWSFLLDSEYGDFQEPDVNIQDWITFKCYFAYILVLLMYVHVYPCNTCTGGSHVAGSYVDVLNSYPSSSLLECSTPTVEAQVWFPAETCQSRDLWFRMKMTLGQISP